MSETKMITEEMKQHYATLPATFEGRIYRHRAGSGADEPAIQTLWGNYALVTKDHQWAKEHYGETVTVKPVPEYYYTVTIYREENQQMSETKPYILRPDYILQRKCDLREPKESDYMYHHGGGSYSINYEAYENAIQAYNAHLADYNDYIKSKHK